MFQLIKRFFMIIFLVTSIIGQVLLFNLYQKFKINNPEIEIQAIKFFGLVVGEIMLFWICFYSFKHVLDIFKAQSTTEKDLFAFEKQYQLQAKSIELQSRLNNQVHQQKLEEKEQKQLEEKNQKESKNKKK